MISKKWKIHDTDALEDDVGRRETDKKTLNNWEKSRIEKWERFEL